MSFSIGSPDLDPQTALVEDVRAVFEEMFTETGMETIAYYLKIGYNVTWNDAAKNPGRFQESLFDFLGDFGGKLLMRRIVSRLQRPGGRVYQTPDRAVQLEEVVRRLIPADAQPRTSIPLAP